MMIVADRGFPIPIGGFHKRRALTLMLAVCTMTGTVARAADSSKFNGWISDEMCGAKRRRDGRGMREEVHRGR
jgi:hypothetical protein